MMICLEVVEVGMRRLRSLRAHFLLLIHGMKYAPFTFYSRLVDGSIKLIWHEQGVAPGGSITGTTAPYQSYYAPRADDEEEPEVIKQWRERRDLQLQDREARSEEKKNETIKAAQQNIDDFYENYNLKKEKAIAQTRRDAEEFLESREDTSAGGTSWERIAKLVDLSGKGARGGAVGSDKAKFRELLMSLRKDEKAPGATGY